jgi:serine protease Do
MKNEKNNKGLIVTILISVIILTACIVFDIVINLSSNTTTTNSTTNSSSSSTNRVSSSNTNVTITDEGIAESVAKVYDATVIVKIYSGNTMSGWGSGFVYKTDDNYGYILTNHHVVDGASKIVIEYSDETTVTAELVGSDEYADVAVLKVPVSSVLLVASIGSSDDLRVGDTVFAIGTPISLSYSFTVTRGILSGKDRLVSMSSESDSSSYFSRYQTTETWYMSLIQIDASINSGNSGGPLSNANGEVVGITNSKLVSSYTSGNVENIGFAIPIEYAVTIAEKLENGESLERPVMGVSMTTIDAASSSGITLSDSITYGAVITDVVKNSNAEDAGLKSGDVIIAMDDKKITDYKYLKYYLYNYSIGDSANITYIRNGKEYTTKITFKSSN